MDMNVLSLSTKSHNTNRTYVTPSNDGNILLSHKDTATHHPIDLAVYAIKCAHGGVGLKVRNPTMILFSFAGFLRFDELSSLRFNGVLVIKDLLVIFIRKSKTGRYCQGNEMLTSKENAVVPLSVKYVPKVSGSSGR